MAKRITQRKWLLSLFDLTGIASDPFKKLGWEVSKVDIQNGTDIMLFDFAEKYNEVCLKMGGVVEVGIIAMIPCDNYALCGAKHFFLKDATGATQDSQILVRRVKTIINYFKSIGVLKFWMVENPKTRIHKLNTWLGKPTLVFNPTDYAGYDNHPVRNLYNKETWLFGDFKIPEKKQIAALAKESPIHTKYGGKSIRTKNARSKSPEGFSIAFAKVNN